MEARNSVQTSKHATAIASSSETPSPSPLAGAAYTPDASAALCEHIQKHGFQGHLFSDITLSFLGKDYRLHKIILSQSPYFRSLLSGPWRENGKSRIELQIDDPNVTAEGLESTLAYMYGVSPVFVVENVIAILAAGCFLGLENLCENSVQFALRDLNVNTFARYNHLSEKHCYGKFAESVRTACWSLLCSHGLRELLHYLPKLSLELLCHLLKSDELWAHSESERYKLAKQVLIDWKLARRGSVLGFDGSMPRKTRGKSFNLRKSSKSVHTSMNARTRSSQRGVHAISKHRSSKKKDSSVIDQEQNTALSEHLKEGNETDLQRLRRLWEEDSSQLDGCREGFEFCTELFCGGGIIFAHMEVGEILQVRKELEDANLPPDAANDSMWHSVLLKDNVLKLKSRPEPVDSSSDEDEDDDDDEEEDEMDEDEDEIDEDDEDLSEGDTSDSDRWSTDNGDDSNSSEGRIRDTPSTSPKKASDTSLICFSYLETGSVDDIDPKKRRTTGGFTWAAKPHIGMRLAHFAPFRFGTQFVMKQNKWIPIIDAVSTSDTSFKAREAFYGGSTWKIAVSNEERLDGILCQLLSYERGLYKDTRKEVRYFAKLYVTTSSGLRCVSGTGVRSTQSHVSRRISIHLDRKDVVENEPFRVSAVVQLIDD